MPVELSPSAKRVQDALERLGLSLQVVELPASTRTASDVAQAIGCQVGQIVKSLVFRTGLNDRPILIIASGANRVNEKRFEGLISEPLGGADADFVRQHATRRVSPGAARAGKDDQRGSRLDSLII